MDSLLDGFYEENYADGSRYSGQFQQSQRHGAGEYFYSNGDHYKGTFRLDLRHGDGVLKVCAMSTTGTNSDPKSIGQTSAKRGSLVEIGKRSSTIEIGKRNSIGADGGVAAHASIASLGGHDGNSVDAAASSPSNRRQQNEQFSSMMHVYTGQFHSNERNGLAKVLFADRRWFSGRFKNDQAAGQGVMRYEPISFPNDVLQRDVFFAQKLQTAPLSPAQIARAPPSPENSPRQSLPSPSKSAQSPKRTSVQKCRVT